MEAAKLVSESFPTPVYPIAPTSHYFPSLVEHGMVMATQNKLQQCQQYKQKLLLTTQQLLWVVFLAFILLLSSWFLWRQYQWTHSPTRLQHDVSRWKQIIHNVDQYRKYYQENDQLFEATKQKDIVTSGSGGGGEDIPEYDAVGQGNIHDKLNNQSWNTNSDYAEPIPTNTKEERLEDMIDYMDMLEGNV